MIHPTHSTPSRTTVYTRLTGMAAARSSGNHGSWREGTTLGIAVASGIWLWLAAVDAVAGQPFHTFAVLGGVAAFTAVHYLLNVALGVAVVAAMNGAVREPSLAIAVVFGFVMLEIAFAMLTVLLSHLGLGVLAWARISGGSLIGLAIALVVLSRRHAFATRVRDADRRHDAEGTAI